MSTSSRPTHCSNTSLIDILVRVVVSLTVGIIGVISVWIGIVGVVVGVVVVRQLFRLLTSFLTLANSFHSGSLIGYLSTDMIVITVVVIIMR